MRKLHTAALAAALLVTGFPLYASGSAHAADRLESRANATILVQSGRDEGRYRRGPDREWDGPRSRWDRWEHRRDRRVHVIRGRLVRGVECPAVRADNGRLYSLATRSLRGLRPGDRVQVVGTRAGASFCMAGTTLNVRHIRRIH